MKTFDDYYTAYPNDGRDILDRVLWRLLDSKDCVFPYVGMGPLSVEQVANWEARKEIVSALNALNMLAAGVDVAPWGEKILEETVKYS